MGERCTQAYKSVANIQTFQRTLPFIFMMIECQSMEEACKDFRFNCCHEKREREKKKRLRSIPGYTLTVYPVELFWPVSALSCHRLDLTERSQTQLKCGKNISYLTRLFFTTPKPAIVAQMHVFHVALYCFSRM